MEKMRDAAEKNHRSINGEYVYRLEHSFNDGPTNKDLLDAIQELKKKENHNGG